MSATALYKALIEANVSDETAEKAVEDLPVARDAATKSDVANVRADIAEGRADTAKVRTEVAQLEVRMVKWQVAIHGAFAGLIIAAMGLMIKFWIL